MDYEFWHSVSPCYTEEMWNGNEPSSQGWEHIKGGYCDRWDFRYGYINTYHGELMDADIILCNKVKLFIIGGILNIIEHRYSDKFDEWTYCNKPKYRIYGCDKSNLHDLEPERIEKYLNMKFPNCKAWDLVQARAKELYYGGVVK